MIQLLSSRFQKHVACFILLVFYANTVLAGREYLFSEREEEMKYLVPEPGKDYSTAILADKAQPVKEKHEDVVKKESEAPAVERLQTTANNKSQETEKALDYIGGPGQPEMTAFKAAGADNMVDLFTGDFSYNIPLGDVGGYPLNIFYNSGISMDQEASWVGLGWNINPGTITRSMRGIPDDFNGNDQIRKEMNIKPQINVGVSAGKGNELAGLETFKQLSLSTSTELGIFYNNYRGVGLEFGKSVVLNIKDKNFDACTMSEGPKATEPPLAGSASVGASFNVNSQTGVNVNPSLSVKLFDDAKKNAYGLSASANYNSRIGLQNLSISGEMHKYKIMNGPVNYDRNNSGNLMQFSSSLSFASPSITPSIKMPLTNTNYNLGVSFGKEIKPIIFKNTRLSGYYSESKLSDEDKIQTKSAYGYLYYQEANGNKDAMLDFNRLNDAVYTKSNPVIAMPNYTYDVFAINGQGTGGGFRAYRGDVGSVHDNYTKTRDHAGSIDAEIGVGDLIELGLNLNFVHTPTTAGEWQVGNLAREQLKFSNSSGLHQAAYFKNPAEAPKVDPTFLNNLCDDELVRIKLDDPGTNIPFASPVWERFSNGQTKIGQRSFAGDNTWKKTWKEQRDKRSQVISYLTAEEATFVGLEKKIYYYPLNVFPKGGCNHQDANSQERYDKKGILFKNTLIRKRHHLSEITVTQTDGKRYVYGIPVYNIKEEEVSFNVGKNKQGQFNPPDQNKQLVSYASNDLSTNERGKDHFYQKDAIDPYAHSFLLTGLLSPDYVDVTGDGITDDDLGTSVKFNHTKIQPTSGDGFGWRAPVAASGQAAYNEGLKTDNSDDKGNYTYGERELWYLNSIESKNMIATFTLADREDGKAVSDALGGVTTSGMKRLTRIDIYSKAEWMKQTGKKPIKSIHFEYDYQLCQGTPDRTTYGGKLTLKSIYFTYNGNDRLFKNKYYFKYNTNPAYDRTHNDRWGTYKPGSANGSITNESYNFSSLNNADFPFADQDNTTADVNAAAWTLSEITLPSGAKIKAEFESDDYAFVQDRRATQMFRIAGFGATRGSAPVNKLYSGADHFYIFIAAPATSKADIKKKYLDGINQLFMKLWVKMPSDQYSPAGQDYEAIPTYALIEDYDVVTGNNNLFWIKVQPGKGRFSPMFYSSIQFMTKNLSSKAYPGSDVKGNGPIGILKALAGMIFNTVSFLTGYYNTARTLGFCKEVSLDKSQIRLNNPALDKLGGGLRVKKVTIRDNWKKMTSTDAQNTNGMPDAEYGQEYDYTTTAVVGGEEMTISSGVASYEPIVGAEENPFREIMYYDDHQPLGPNQRGAIEVPLGEVFYPNPSVGYSKVAVRSIHRNNVKSGVGKTITEFYTTKDFPTRSDFISFDKASHVRFKSNPILSLLKLDVRETISLSQGFRIQTNDMNGKMHKQITYDESGKQVSLTENIYRIVKTGEQKYSFNNVVPMLSKASATVQESLMGKEIEVMTDFREHVSKAVTFNINFNVNTNMWGPFPVPIPSIIPPVHYAETGYRSASALKIINTFGILEKVRVVDKGSEVSTKNLMYDAETGNVLVTETNNEFNEPVYSFNYPAHWAYTGMQGAYKNIDAVFEDVRFQNGKLTTPGFDMGIFESGDELFVSDKSPKGAMQEPACYPSGPIQYIPKPLDPENKARFVRKIWALDMTKDPNNTEKKFLFIDKEGEPYSGGDVTIKIIRSGKRNLVDVSAGGFTSLENPINQSTLLLTPNDQAKILNTAANTFKENWRVDDAFYTQDEIDRVVRQTPIVSTILSPVQRYSAQVERRDHRQEFVSMTSNSDNYFQIFKKRNKRSKGLGSTAYYYDINSWVRYSLPANMEGAKVISATLRLAAHNGNHQNLIPNGRHNTNEPHYNGDEEGSGYFSKHVEFRVSRMITPWYSNNNNWYTVFDDHPNYISDPVLVSQVPFSFPPAGSFTRSLSPNITFLTQRMVDNITNPNITTGIKLSFTMHSGNINQYIKSDAARWRYCFEKEANIDVSYYRCSPSDPIIYQGVAANAPTTPPAGYMYCATDEKVTHCYSHFTKKRMNPYTKGVLGNWRADISYVYYAERRESSAAVQTEELSKAGVIATNYKSFWIPDGDGIKVNNDAITATPGNPAQWQWNSKVTQFNNKGFELENTDRLGRFNCGIYGYDKSLPVAVANNSKLRSTAYDGFEDYNFQSYECQPFCKPKRHLIVENAINNLDNTVRHSGLYSLKVAPGNSVSVKTDVVTTADDEEGYSIKISNAVTTANGTWVNPAGTGINGKYFNYGPINKGFLQSSTSWHNEVRDAAQQVLNSNTGFTLQTDPYIRKQSNGNYAFLMNPGIKPPDGIGHRPAVNGYDFYCVRWEGYIQTPEAGTIRFKVISDDGMKVFIDGQQINLGNYFYTHGPAPAEFTVNWAVGSVHQLRIDYYEEKGDQTAFLTWKLPSQPEFEVVPKDYLYVQLSHANNTVINGVFNCIKPDDIQVQNNALTDVFSPIQGQKMVFSVWVKEDAADCHCTNYTNNRADIYFNNSSTVSTSFTPSGKIIEGWQRYEGVFSIPANATSMEIKLVSTGSKTVYWDDLRLHPFNGNMKSFVYHPSTLRLMAEQDENNYSSFYEYDADGTLTRVKKETTQGIKTITETRSALQKKITD